MLPASDEVHIGGFVVQVFRTDQDRNKQYLAKAPMGEWDKITWWTREN